MNTVLLGSGRTCDISKQVLSENQIVVFHGQGAYTARCAVWKVEHRDDGCNYRLINLETKAFSQTDLVRPLHEKFGIGYYYDVVNPEFMDAFEVMMLHSEATYKAEAEQEAQRKRQERAEQLKVAGRQRLEAAVPADAKAVIVAELHEDESDMMTDYFGYSTRRTVILGFSTHTKDLFSEMRKYAANFEETAYLAAENPKYEHREKYTGGSGYYLGESKYYGWTVTKKKCYGRENIIERYAMTAGDEANICISQVQAATDAAPDAVTGDFIIVDYSEKALAVFGDTKPVKDELKALGGRFNPKLTHEGTKKAGWIFSKSKKQELNSLLISKQLQ